MHKIATLLIPLTLLLAAGCKSISVDSTYDAEFDFAKLHTFNWAAVPPRAETALNDKGLVELIGAQIEAAGLQKVEADPDVLVAVHRTLGGGLNTDQWGYTREGGRLRYYTMQQGTLVVDFVDAATNHNIWRGSAEGVFRFDMLPAEREAMLRDVLQQMFADYPPR